MFCLTLLISITLVACGSDDKKKNEDVNNNDNANTNNEEQVDTNSNENENNADSDINLEENEDIDTNLEENAGSDNYDFDPNGENVVALQAEQNGVTVKVIYKADGDKVIEQTADNTIPYEAIDVTTAEEAEEILADAVAGYQDAKGITHTMDYQDDKVIESLTIDFETADMEEVSELTGIISEGEISEGISFRRSVDMLLKQGFEIVE